MKLKMTRGCICDSLTIDGKEEINLTEEERKQIWLHVCDTLKSKDPKHLNELLQFILENYGNYACSTEPCECCGDFVETFKLDTNF